MQNVYTIVHLILRRIVFFDKAICDVSAALHEASKFQHMVRKSSSILLYKTAGQSDFKNRNLKIEIYRNPFFHNGLKFSYRNG